MMKGVQVYHTIKVLSSHGCSIRRIAKQLKMSKTTVQNYLKMQEEEVSTNLISVNRKSEFDQYRNYLVDQIGLFPSIRITKLYRKLVDKYPDHRFSY